MNDSCGRIIKWSVYEYIPKYLKDFLLGSGIILAKTSKLKNYDVILLQTVSRKLGWKLNFFITLWLYVYHFGNIWMSSLIGILQFIVWSFIQNVVLVLPKHVLYTSKQKKLISAWYAFLYFEMGLYIFLWWVILYFKSSMVIFIKILWFVIWSFVKRVILFLPKYVT